jgi:hypothetical protein
MLLVKCTCTQRKRRSVQNKWHHSKAATAVTIVGEQSQTISIDLIDSTSHGLLERSVRKWEHGEFGSTAIQMQEDAKGTNLIHCLNVCSAVYMAHLIMPETPRSYLLLKHKGICWMSVIKMFN